MKMTPHEAGCTIHQLTINTSEKHTKKDLKKKKKEAQETMVPVDALASSMQVHFAAPPSKLPFPSPYFQNYTTQ